LIGFIGCCLSFRYQKKLKKYVAKFSTCSQ
jgi:hypothetical protein